MNHIHHSIHFTTTILPFNYNLFDHFNRPLKTGDQYVPPFHHFAIPPFHHSTTSLQPHHIQGALLCGPAGLRQLEEERPDEGTAEGGPPDRARDSQGQQGVKNKNKKQKKKKNIYLMEYVKHNMKKEGTTENSLQWMCVPHGP